MTRSTRNLAEIARLHTEIMKIPFELNFIGKQMEKVLIESHFYQKNNFGFLHKAPFDDTRITSHQLSSNYERNRDIELTSPVKSRHVYIKDLLEEMREGGYKTEKGKIRMEEIKNILKIKEKLGSIMQKIQNN